MIISLNNKTRLGCNTDWMGCPGMYHSMCKTNMGCVRTHLCKSSGTVIDEMYEIWNTKLGMKSMTFCYMVQSK